MSDTRNEIRVPVLFGSNRPKIWLRRCKDPYARLAIKEYILNKKTKAATVSLTFLLLTLAGCAGDNIPFNPNDLDPCLRNPPVGKC